MMPGWVPPPAGLCGGPTDDHAEDLVVGLPGMGGHALDEVVADRLCRRRPVVAQNQPQTLRVGSPLSTATCPATIRSAPHRRTRRPSPGLDYQVFVVSRIREAARRGLTTSQAVRQGITSSAGVVTSAAVVMVSVFVSFGFLHLLEVKRIGFGLAVAVLLDAIVIRIMILPSLMTLLGRATWWPSREASPPKRTG